MRKVGGVILAILGVLLLGALYGLNTSINLNDDIEVFLTLMLTIIGGVWGVLSIYAGLRLLTRKS